MDWLKVFAGQDGPTAAKKGNKEGRSSRFRRVGLDGFWRPNGRSDAWQALRLLVPFEAFTEACCR